MERSELEMMAAAHYICPSPTQDDLLEDLARIRHLRKLLTRWKEGDQRPELVLIHIKVLFNVFESGFARFLLRLHFPAKPDWRIVNTFIDHIGQSFDHEAIDRSIQKRLGDIRDVKVEA